jgi:Bacterial TniB protein
VTLDLSHLSSTIREHAFDSNQDRIRQVRAANWVGYGRARRALERLDELIEQPSCAPMPCLLLYGDSGMGKTMIVEKFERMHPAQHDKSTGTETRPVVILQMPVDRKRGISRFRMCLWQAISPSKGVRSRGTQPCAAATTCVRRYHGACDPTAILGGSCGN